MTTIERISDWRRDDGDGEKENSEREYVWSVLLHVYKH